MSEHVEFRFIIDFDSYSGNFAYLKSNIVSAIRNELAKEYAAGRISKPELTEPLLNLCDECRGLIGP